MLTSKQEMAVKLGASWYSNRTKPVFTIAGYAGTGKTYTVSRLVEAPNISRHQIKFVTLTGKASLVLTKHGNPACTIHKLIYDPETIIDPKTGKKKVIFNLKEELDEDIRLIIIDEMSMVNRDIMKDLLSFKVPIVCLGDPGQLS